MKLVIFGVSGKTGRAVSEEALRSGFSVVGVDRKSTDIISHNGRGEYILVDYGDVADLKRIVAGADGVFIAFGPRPPYKDIFCAEATKNIVTAMAQMGVSRLICQTGAMIGNYPENRPFLFKKMTELFIRNNPLGYKDRVEQEEIVKQSSLRWTIIKPPRLNDTLGNKRIAVGDTIVVGLLSSLSRVSLAKFVIGEFINGNFINKAMFIKN